MGGEVIQYYKRDAKTYEKRRFRRGGKLVHEIEMNNIVPTILYVMGEPKENTFIGKSRKQVCYNRNRKRNSRILGLNK